MLAVMLGPSSAGAETARDTNAHGWYMYFGDHPLSERWELHLEGQWRRHDVLSRWQQLLLRPGLNFKINDRLTLACGYTYFRNYPYGEFPREALETEHRAYEDVEVSHGLGRVDSSSRVRLEQRFAAPREPDTNDVADWEYRNRVRYRLDVRVPLRAASVEASRLYLSFYDEVFVNWGANGGARALNQNRAYGALGVNLPGQGQTSLELGYLHQYLPQSNGRIVEHNHTLQVSVRSRLSFRRGD